MKLIYLISSLRNPNVPLLANELRKEGFEVFDSWFAPGPQADDYWRDYTKQRGLSYKEALNDWSAKHVFEFDKFHIDRSDIAVLAMPAGKSGFLELGYMLGSGKPGIIYFPDLKTLEQLPEDWKWLTGLYEGEGSISCGKNRKGVYSQFVLSITSTDFDIIQRLYRVSKVGRVQGPYLNLGNNLIKKPKNLKPQWRWSVYKYEDILYVLNGMWKDLGERRKAQIISAFNKVGLSEKEIFEKGESPWELRYDVMLQFAQTAFSYDDLIKELDKVK